ncbi:glycosyltransferase [Georgenia sp. MJ173]|uniref:glycosyltransferase family 2 protein n=1 Tax=Georgenia sunbinii TaxID=3117728 RepID=UPI002F2628FF
MINDIERVLITVITYRRPAELERMLHSLLQLQTTLSHRIVVVDNDPEGGARSIVRNFSERVQYVHEPMPGIAAARNRCIELITSDDDAIIFTDDDEVVTPDWLEELVQCAHVYAVDIVAGPVVSVLPKNAPKWILNGNYFQRRIRKTGASDGLPATNNVLVRSKILTIDAAPRFDDAYSATGGSDTDFFSRLVGRGHSFVWCETARVVEYIQADRVTLPWLIRRFTRGGETHARVQRQIEPAWRLVLRGGSLLVAGIVCAPLSLLFVPRLRGRNLMMAARGLGIIRGTLGLRVHEYARAVG